MLVSSALTCRVSYGVAAFISGMASDALYEQDAGVLKLPQGQGRLAPGTCETPVESRGPGK